MIDDDDLTPKQKTKLNEWLEDGKLWISVDAAIRLIEERLNTTTGHAQKLLADARASREVRFGNDDGIVCDPRFDYAFRKDDLIGWLDRQFAKQQPTDKPRRTRQSVKRARANEAIKTLWPDGIPPAVLNDVVYGQVVDWIRTDCKKQKIAFVDIGRSTILRAAGRKE